MLADNDAIATIAVKDLQAARKFYGDALGLREQAGPDNPEVITYESGGSKILVYRSSYAGTNEATVVTWAVRELEHIVEALKAKGVVFEHYDLPQLARRGDVHVAGDGFRVVWFKDPDGNILSILTAPA
ncbi:MAG TPA: VOC family protein [Candidatus Elarobacter sp.]|nr:VOC family protein [Candidatus Elarobacter sp.]